MTYPSEGRADPFAADDPYGALMDPDDVIGGLPDDDFEGWFSSAVKSVGGAVKSVGKGALKVTGSPAVKWGLRGVAIAVPAAAPGVAAIELARASYRHADDALSAAAAGSRAAKESIRLTVAAAKRGDRSAQRGVEVLKVAAKARKAKASPKTLAKVAAAPTAALPARAGSGVLLLPDGRRVPVEWVSR